MPHGEVREQPGNEPKVAVATATATLEDSPSQKAAERQVAAPVAEERLKEIVLRFAQLEHVRQVAAMRTSGEVIEMRGAGVDMAGLGSLAPSSLRLLERHGHIRSYYLLHPQGQLFLFPLAGGIVAIVGNKQLNLGAVFTALAALEEEL